jgi:hypothetical protein
VTAGKGAGRVRLTVSVPRAIAEQIRREAEEHQRSVACEGGLLIRIGIEARSGSSKPAPAEQRSDAQAVPCG